MQQFLVLDDCRSNDRRFIPVFLEYLVSFCEFTGPKSRDDFPVCTCAKQDIEFGNLWFRLCLFLEKQDVRLFGKLVTEGQIVQFFEHRVVRQEIPGPFAGCLAGQAEEVLEPVAVLFGLWHVTDNHQKIRRSNQNCTDNLGLVGESFVQLSPVLQVVWTKPRKYAAILGGLSENLDATGFASLKQQGVCLLRHGLRGNTLELVQSRIRL